MPDRICQVDGCERPLLARGWCGTHYGRWAKYGQVELPTMVERFWMEVDKNGPVSECRPDLGPCWLWTGGISDRPSGAYGRIWDRAAKEYVYTHRFSFELARSMAPEGLDLDHLCRVRLCCNPDHLEPVTRAVNVGRGRNWLREMTHCRRGHEFTAENTRTYRRGNAVCRECRPCRRERRLLRQQAAA